MTGTIPFEVIDTIRQIFYWILVCITIADIAGFFHFFKRRKNLFIPEMEKNRAILCCCILILITLIVAWSLHIFAFYILGGCSV